MREEGGKLIKIILINMILLGSTFSSNFKQVTNNAKY